MKKRIITYSLILLLVLISTLTPAIGMVGSASATAQVSNDDDPIKVVYTGTWTDDNAAAGYYLTDQHYASYAADMYVVFTWTGTTAAWVGAKIPDGGQADVYVDDELKATVDTYAASPALQQTLYTSDALTLGQHTLKITIKSEKNASSSGTKISIDKFSWNDGGVLHCYNGLYPGTCTEVEPNHLRYVLTTGDPNHVKPQYTLDADRTIYFKMTGASAWIRNRYAGGPVTTIGNFAVKIGGASLTVLTGPAVGYWEEKTWTISPLNLQEDLTAGGPYSAETSISNSAIADVNLTYVIELTTTPPDTCASGYVVLNSATFEINPTVEFPTTAPQVYPTVADHDYKIDISGGPWSDGTNANRKDAAISWDGTTWIPLTSADAECITQDPNNPTAGLSVVLKAAAGSFHIRVNDTAGAFANNTGSLTYTISTVIKAGGNDCDSQFTYDETDDLIETVTVPGNSDYVAAPTALIAGDWYAFAISSGSWADGSAPSTARYDAQYSWSHVGTFIWNLLGESGGESGFCVTTDGNYKTAYMQADLSGTVNFRVNDTGGNFADNTGSLAINIYHVTYVRTPNECELRFKISDLVGHSVLQGGQENGLTIAVSTTNVTTQQAGSFQLVAGAWYMFETTDGPWGYVNTSSQKSYEAAINWEGAWTALDEWSQSACSSQLDSLGHVRVFFQAPADGGASYKLRVNDMFNWFSNVGNLGVDLYKAYDQSGPPDGQCDYSYDQNQPIGAMWIDAKLEHGNYLPGIVSNSLYAIEIQGDQYHWHENSGAAESYDMQISDDDGTAWHDVPTGYGAVMCYIQVGNKTVLIVQSGANYLYKMRVDSTSFSDNEGGMGVNVYAANPGGTVNPWVSGCLSAFGSDDGAAKYPIDSFEWITVTNPVGEPIITSVNWTGDGSIIGFAVEILNGPWHMNDASSPDEHYDAALSKDNGVTFHEINRDNPDVLCAEDDQLHRYWTAYFTVADEDKWMIRVNDEDAADWSNNTGNLAFKLYAITSKSAAGPDCVIETNNPQCIPPNVPIAINGQDACTLAITRPSSVLEVGGWIQYGVMIMMQYMAWCPQHTDALMLLLDVLKDKEPYASLLEFNQVVAQAKAELDAYNWDDGTAPESIIQDPGGVSDQVVNNLFPMDAKSPWAGGPVVDLEAARWTPTSYYNSCVGNLNQFLGSILVKPVCFASDEVRETGASFWIQLMLDIGAVFWGFGMVFHDVKKLAHFMVGVSYIPPAMERPEIQIDLSDLSNPRIGRK